MLTPEKLGKILYEEFDHDKWGTIDPFYFKSVPKVGDGTDMDGIFEVLERVVERLKKVK